VDSSLVIAGGAVCFGSLIALIVVLAVVSHRREKARQQALELWAMQHEWQISRRPQVDWGRRMPGRNKRGVTVALSGMIRGRPATIAEYYYTYTTTSTDSSGRSSSTTRTYHYVLMVVPLRQPHPTVAVFRRGTMSRFGRALFGDKATALGYEPFDSEYRVAANDPRLVRSVLGPALVNEHIAGRLPDWSLEGRELLSFREGRIGEPASIPGQLEAVIRVADLIEPHR
jgi:hypothetical protein